MQEYGLGLIADLIRIYDSKPPQWPDSLRKWGYSTYEVAATLIKATKLFAGYEEAKAGKAFVYGLVDSADEPGQDLAMRAIVDFDGEDATEVLLAKLKYPMERARITAASLLGDHGRLDCVAELQRILDERIRSGKKEWHGRDDSLAVMQTAIEKLKDRAKGIDGPSVSERMSAKDLIERGPPVTKPPDPSHAETPEIPQELATVAKTQTLPAPAGRMSDASTPSSAFLWTGAGVSVALLVGLVVYWKRRV